MRKFLFLLFLILFFKIDVYGQFAYGTTGLLHMPTAEMQKDKTFMFGGSVLNPETLPSKEWWGNYYTFNYYLNITIFPWLEVGYNCVLVKGKPGIYDWPEQTYGKFVNQDRSFHGRLRVWKEGWWKDWTPQIVIGANDPTTGSWEGGSSSDDQRYNGFFCRYYVALTKHIEFADYGTLGGHARCHFEDLNFDQAIDACDYALIGDDEFADAYVMKGHCFYQLGNEDAALECYQKAEQMHGLAPEFVYTYIGLCKVSKGEWEEGYENLEKAIQANEAEETPAPTLPSLYANAGLCLSKMKKKRKAHQYCKKAQKLEPKDPEAYLIEGRMYVEEGDYEKGIKQWAKALNCAPSADTWNEIGMHSMEIGYLDYAIIAFERVCELEPEFEGINEKLTVLYMTLHDKETFIKYNQKCTRPYDLKELEKMQAMMENEDREDLAVYMQDIIKALQ